MGLAFNRRHWLIAPTNEGVRMPVRLAVALGGALGSLARYEADRLIERRSFSIFPWSTFTINVTGCLLIGVVIAALVDQHHTPVWIRAGLVMGVLGGYTTFSTFAQEGLSLFEEGRSGVALAYTLGSVVTGVIAVYAGTRIGRLI
jgi:CrcB protein